MTSLFYNIRSCDLEMTKGRPAYITFCFEHVWTHVWKIPKRLIDMIDIHKKIYTAVSVLMCLMKRSLKVESKGNM